MTKIITKFLERALIAALLLPLLSSNAGAQERTTVSDNSTSGTTRDSLMIPTLNGLKPFKYITGAVSHISGQQISTVPGTNRFNSLAGRLPGLSVTQSDGLPGFENSDMLVRGFHTLTGSAPLVLINGRRDDATMLDPNDIESITILKDAASTVLYGLTSANGIVLITTKKGKEGNVKVNYNLQTSFQQPTRLPKFLDSYNYATLYNEATLNDNPLATPRYDATALQAYQTGSDPFRYPNVNWTDELLRDYTMQTRNSLNVSGGGKTARYFFSGSYLSDGGIFNVDESVNTYNTNTNINVLNVRANIELDITKNLSLVTDVRSKREKHNAPGARSDIYDETLFFPLYATPANAHPIRNADGSLAGTNDYRNNPYGMLNYNGYSNYIVTSLSTFSELTYNLGSLVKGLNIKANFGFNNYTQFNINRTKAFEVYSLNANGSYTKIGANSPITNGGGYDDGVRIFDHSVSLNYDSSVGKHNLSAMLMYDRDQIDYIHTKSLTRNLQGPKGSISYRFNNRYLIDFSAAYQGSEQYPKGDRYGFFPALSAGWIASEESFLKNSGIDFLKLRGSIGRTGNQTDLYYGYLGSYSRIASQGGVFGTTTPASTFGVYQNILPNPLVTWEKNLKTNAGLDLALLNNRFSASVDYFTEEAKDIMITNAITAMYGANISTPEGAFKNRGFEVQAGWGDKVNQLQYSVNVNFSRTHNEIVNRGEAVQEYPWMYTTGNPTGSRMGYVFDRFFTEQDNISSLPNQSLLGVQRPGDLKYKDLNADGIINENDITKIGDAKIPEVNFGANFGLALKGFDLNVLFQGTANSTTYNGGNAYWEFVNRTGNVSEHHLNRWTPGSGQSAGYPRLTLSNTNNFVSNSYWVQDNSFVRLKFMELGYTLPVTLVSKIKMTGARIFINGNNLFLWDDVNQKDPETQDSGIGYPLQRAFSLGLSAKF